jgi:hypothetical protein
VRGGVGLGVAVLGMWRSVCVSERIVGMNAYLVKAFMPNFVPQSLGREDWP